MTSSPLCASYNEQREAPREGAPSCCSRDAESLREIRGSGISVAGRAWALHGSSHVHVDRAWLAGERQLRAGCSCPALASLPFLTPLWAQDIISAPLKPPSPPRKPYDPTRAPTIPPRCSSQGGVYSLSPMRALPRAPEVQPKSFVSPASLAGPSVASPSLLKRPRRSLRGLCAHCPCSQHGPAQHQPPASLNTTLRSLPAPPTLEFPETRTTTRGLASASPVRTWPPGEREPGSRSSEQYWAHCGS